MPQTVAWDSFYVIVGSAAGALIGLQFVVMTLISQRASGRSPDAAATFMTPTIVHLSVVLLLAALARVPWPTVAVAGRLWALIGLGGLAYAANTVRRMCRQHSYTPEFEDWVFHAAIPFVAYALLAVSAFAFAARPQPALFGIAAAVLMLLFDGIHNAWDNVAYHVLVIQPRQEAARRGEGAAGDRGA